MSHRFHGDASRFEVVADFVSTRFPDARTAADVAGGQGMLARRLTKRHNIECDVVDPRGWTLRGVAGHAQEFDAGMAAYYDVIIGLHPDEALPAVVAAAAVRPALVVPCCNFWDRDVKLSRDALLAAISAHHRERRGDVEHHVLNFRGPHNHALVLMPPRPRTAT